MIRVLLDANIIVSGLLRFRSGSTPPARILRAWFAENYQLLTSEHILDEVTRTISKPWFQERMDPEIQSTLLHGLRHEAEIVTLIAQVENIASHPEDDLVLAAAVSGEAAYLVTGDNQLLKLQFFVSTRIVDARSFLELIEAKSKS